VIALAERWSVVPLLGNHEEMLLAALEGQSELRYWLKLGGSGLLSLSFIKCIDTFCPGGCWLTALEVGTGRVWQSSLAGEMRGRP